MGKMTFRVQPRQGSSPTGTIQKTSILNDRKRRTTEISYTYDVSVMDVFDYESGRFTDYVAVEATLVVNERRSKVSDLDWVYDSHDFIKIYVSESPYANQAYEAFQSHIELMLFGTQMFAQQQLELTDDHGEIETPNPTYSR